VTQKLAVHFVRLEFAKCYNRTYGCWLGWPQICKFLNDDGIMGIYTNTSSIPKYLLFLIFISTLIIYLIKKIFFKKIKYIKLKLI
jgi:hypothetical protein